MHGELIRLGCQVSEATVRRILRALGFRPAPQPGHFLAEVRSAAPAQRRKVLGGVINEYHRAV